MLLTCDRWSRFVNTLPPISYVRRADGVSLAFTVAGEGPALVLVPVVPFSNLRMEWRDPILRPVFDQLARRLTLVHYDGRGTGHSQRDVTDLSLKAMVSDLEAVIDRVGLAEVSLLGQYSSCPHAICYAARHPQQVKRMALFGGSARGWDILSGRRIQALLSLIEQDWDLFAEVAAHQWLGWSAGEADRAQADKIRGAVTPQIARATLQSASAVDVTDQLPDVAAPTLVLHRGDITHLPIDVPRSLARSLPRARLPARGLKPKTTADSASNTAVTSMITRRLVLGAPVIHGPVAAHCPPVAVPAACASARTGMIWIRVAPARASPHPWPAR
jgi:pimeloyl-ACP methyl ester carboxylesterase